MKKLKEKKRVTVLPRLREAAWPFSGQIPTAADGDDFSFSMEVVCFFFIFFLALLIFRRLVPNQSEHGVLPMFHQRTNEELGFGCAKKTKKKNFLVLLSTPFKSSVDVVKYVLISFAINAIRFHQVIITSLFRFKVKNKIRGWNHQTLVEISSLSKKVSWLDKNPLCGSYYHFF